MKLIELQTMFADALVHPASIAKHPSWSQRGDAELTGSARLSPIEQLDVYREQFWIRHVNCLAEDFPVLRALVGEERFEAIVADYLKAFPPTKFRLRDLGMHLAELLATKDDALVAELARLEWAFIDAFDAPDAPPLDPNVIASIAEDQWPLARLRLHPSLQRMRLVYSAHKMRELYRENEALRPIARPAPTPAPSSVVVYRHKFLLYTEEMDALAYDMLELLARGEPLGAAGDALAQSTNRGPEIETRIGEWFTRWSALGWLASIHFED